MKIVTIMGSPRKTGHTANLLSAVECELTRLKHSVDRIELVDFRVNYCKGRTNCKRGTDSISCEQNDDVSSLFERMQVADLILYSTPLYFWSYSGLLKNFIDRHYCLVTEEQEGSMNSIISGKKTGLMVTCRDFDTGCTAELQAMFKRFASFFMLNLTDILVVPFVKDQSQLNTEMQAHAISFAHTIVGEFSLLNGTQVLESI